MNKELSENRLNNIFSNILYYNILDDIEYVLVQGDTSTACAPTSIRFLNWIIKNIKNHCSYYKNL